MATTKIVVGYDGSAGSRAAAAWALDDAARTGALVEFVYAWEWPACTPAAPMVPGITVWPTQETAHRVTGMLHEARAAAAVSHPAVRATTAILNGAAAPVLTDRSRQAGLLVLGGHGHGGWADLLLGSVSTAVTAHAHCPVVVVRGDPSSAADDARPIVVGVDGSPCAQLALGFAFEQAAARKAALSVIRAWLPPGPPWTDLAVDRAAALADERAAVEESVARWREKFPEVRVTTRVVADHPAHALVAASDAARLAVVGSRGHGGLAGLLLGSVSRQLVQRGGCPVAVVRERPAAATP